MFLRLVVRQNDRVTSADDDIIVHSNPGKYPQQRMFVVTIEQYAYLVPFVEETEYYFLKTVIPNRKATRDYLKGGV